MVRSEYAANLYLQPSHRARQVLTSRVHRVTRIEPLVRFRFWIVLACAVALKVFS